MTTTPTIWKPPTIVNQTAGNQYQPQSIGLTNGNLLIVWGDNQFGTAPGADIVGAFYDPIFIPLGSQFEVNDLATEGNEFQARLAALPGGDFVMAYRKSSDFSLVVERHNSEGTIVSVRFINEFVTHWDVTVNDDGDYIVAFDVLDGSRDVHAFVYDGETNDAGAEHLLTAQNGEDREDLAAIDTFGNGDIIAVYSELDGTDFGQTEYRTTEVRVTSATGAAVTSPVELAGAEDHGAVATDIAVLTGGQFVALYYYEEGTSNIAFRMGSVSGSSITFGSETTVAPGAGEQTQLPSIVALNDGGFFIAWIGDNKILGTRYDANGAVVGLAANQFALGASSDREALGQLSLTSDGRILVPYRASNNEIAQLVLDPRENFIVGTDSDDVMMSQTTGTFLFGQGGNDRLYGSAGQDFINGETGNDTISGDAGQDTIHGNEDNDTLSGSTGGDLLFGDGGADVLWGGTGNDTLDGGDGSDQLRGGLDNDSYVLATAHLGAGLQFRFDGVFEDAGDGIDTVFVQRTVFGNLGTYALTANVEHGTIQGTDAFDLTGNGEANRLTGNDAANTLNGLAGVDQLNGGGGADILNGGGNLDRLSGGAGKDTLDGGANIDIFDYRTVSDSTSTNFDTVIGADFGADDWDISLSLTTINTAITTGRLRANQFDSDLAAAADATHLSKRGAVLFTPDAGSHAGKTFLIVSQNGVFGYQAGGDLVIELVAPVNLGGLDLSDFI
jgi:Ca2+-binding RTX toxin-like protein